ncbi:hypothetical protein L1049_010898 [Liquidambar formosana]|uniref:Pentatricopeptide repeat-containing protein n=1 Tax=Liquidambar formosana TaxID=63359 RepID=A0AAP0RQR2_LIQFO
MSTTQTLLKTLLQYPSSIRTRSQAKQLHAQIIKNKGPSPFHLSMILSIYSNLSLLDDSLLVFNTLHPSPPSLAWKSIIRCYASHGLSFQSLASFVEMRASGKYPDRYVFPSVLKSCTLLMDLRLGESVHGCIVQLGMDFDLYTRNALMNMYSRLESLGDCGGHRCASKVVDEIPEPKRIVECRKELIGSNEFIDRIASEEYEVDGRRLHFYGTSNGEAGSGGRSYDNSNEFGKQVAGVDRNVNLIQMSDKLPQRNMDGAVFDHSHAKINTSIGKVNKEALRMDSVRKVFEIMPKRDLVSWNTVIAGNAQNGMYEEALMMVRDMGNAN